MRPVLGDNRAGRSDFHIQFDPVNALTVSMVTEEMRRSNITSASQLNYTTRRRLEQIYKALALTMPQDPAGLHYAALMRTHETPLAVAARQVLRQIVRAAVENQALATTAIEGTRQPTRRKGDALTNYYVREAARAAKSLPDEVATQAFLLGVAIGLDTAASPARLPGISSTVRAVESDSERQMRRIVLGQPTIRDRIDLPQRFFSSACLTATNGADATKAAALDAELLDARRPGGFSFKHIAADRAGARFGRSVVDKRFRLHTLATSFDVASYMPPVDKLADGISAKDLTAKYGSKTDARFVKQLQDMDQRVLVLPGYLATGATFGK
jgi:hypothetical protein